jgi:hypothetical protein
MPFTQLNGMEPNGDGMSCGVTDMSKTARRLRRLMPRTEAEWLACDDPSPMLEVLRAKASDRKVRLFAVGCCRLTLTDSAPDRSRHAVEIAERFADGLASKEELLRARTLAFYAAQQFSCDRSRELGQIRRTLSASEMRLYFIAEAAHPYTPYRIGLLRHRLRWDHELMRIAPVVLRDLIGNPFGPVAFDPCWRMQNVIGLALTIYDKRSFDRMPMLADALENSGCNDAEILNHCRNPGEHARGCWVIDHLLGKS